MSTKRLHWLPELIREGARRFGDATALSRSGSNTVSYRELERAMLRGAAVLRGHGLVSGDRILITLPAGPEWATAFFAVLEAGLVPVPLPSGTDSATVETVRRHAETRAAITAPDGGGISTAELLEGSDETGGNDRHEVALLAFTSGSTSRPRAVELTHGNLLADLAALLKVRRAAPGDAFLSILPPAHLFELMGGLIAPLACGARVVYAGAPLPNRVVEALRQEEISHAMAVPALLSAIYQELVAELVEAGVLDRDQGSHDPAEAAARLRDGLSEQEVREISSGLRRRIGQRFHMVVVGGAAIDPDIARVLAAYDIRVEVGYGLTEASPIVSVGLARDCPTGSVGRPLPGVEVSISQQGEVLVRGPTVMRGYFKDPSATEAALQDGWLRTGDRGRIDQRGFLFLTGRCKEAMVTSAGETIYPEEVEPFYASPSFTEACVAALPDADGNDQPTLFVVAEGEAAELFATFNRLRAAAPPRLFVKQLIRLSEPLPRTATGKIKRTLLGEMYGRQQA